MAGPDDDLTYYYDENLPYGGQRLLANRASARRPRAPRVPGWPRWPRRRRARSAGQRSVKLNLSELHPFRRIGDGLVALTSADGALVGSRNERHRYATVGVLMLLTAAQAFYAATLFFSVGLGKPFSSVIFFGLFFAAAVLLIDRSIISYAAPIKKGKDGKLRTPRKANGVLFIRVGIAIVAAILMSEMILLQVFASDISQQIQNDHINATQTADNQIEANYQARITKLQDEINAAQATVNADQVSVTNATKQMNCQEFGCPGIAKGMGPGFRAAQATLEIAQQKLTAAQASLKSVTSTNDQEISQLNAEEKQAITAAQPAINNADKVLSQEAAFWQLTVKNGNVLAVRVLLSLLILGIDLAPILTKLTGRTTVHDIRAHANDYHLHEQLKNETDVAVYKYGKRADTDRTLHDLAVDSDVFDARQEDGVKRSKSRTRAAGQVAKHEADLNVYLYKVKHNANLDKIRHYRAHAREWAEWEAMHAARSAPGAAGNGHGPAPGPGDGGQGHGRAWSPDNNVRQSFNLPAPVRTPAGPGPVPSVEDEVPYPPSPGELADDREAEQVPSIPPEPEDFRPPAGSDPAWEMAGILWGMDGPPRRLLLNNRYELHEELPGADVGGGGTVWLARDLRDQSRGWVVVKRVPSATRNKDVEDQHLRLGIEHEHRVAGMVGDHIGQVLNRGTDHGYSYLVYPLYQPGSLEKFCQREKGRLTLAWCARIIDEVLSGLITASEHNLVHLDIKPGNIVLDGEHARIIDWGLSRKWDATSAWVLRGTPFYACPEQLTSLQGQGRWDTPTADLYGVGATFYRLLTGEAPFQHEVEADDGPYPLEVYVRLLLQGFSPQPVHELVPGVPPELGRLIQRWMSFEPAHRVPPGVPRTRAAQFAHDELSALRPSLPDMIVGQVTGDRRTR